MIPANEYISLSNVGKILGASSSSFSGSLRSNNSGAVQRSVPFIWYVLAIEDPSISVTTIERPKSAMQALPLPYTRMFDCNVYVSEQKQQNNPYLRQRHRRARRTENALRMTCHRQDSDGESKLLTVLQSQSDIIDLHFHHSKMLNGTSKTLTIPNLCCGVNSLLRRSI